MHLRRLFADDAKRGERLTLEASGIYLDYSKNRITDETMVLLVELAEQSGLRARIDAMFSGERINVSENRPVLHVALRAPKDASILVDGANVVPQVHAVLDKVSDFANRVRGGDWQGYTGKRIRNVVNIGIGGSDLGPVMAYQALKHYSERALTFRFVSNVDGTDFVEAVRDLDPAETLFIVASKTFTTLETMTNANAARAWSVARAGREPELRSQAFRGRLHQCSGGVEVRHRYREHVRVLGLGRRPLFHGFGHRTVDGPGDRTGQLPRAPRWLSRDGRALPDGTVRTQSARRHGSARCLVQQFLRSADRSRPALRTVPRAVSRLPAAADDGEQWQARDARRRGRRATIPVRSTGASPARTGSTRFIS